MKKTFKILSWGLLALAVLAAVYYSWIYYEIKSGNMVKWEGRWYTKAEIQEKYGPQYYDVQAKNTPEEVYANFRQALLDGDTEKALSLMTPGRREEYKKAFEDKEKLDKWIKTLPEKMISGKIEGNFGYFDWNKNDGYKHTIDFVKNRDGYWQIDAI